MIIDAHAHACGDFLAPQGIIRTLDANGVDRVVLVPGELGSDRTYNLPDLAGLFPDREVVSITNRLTRAVIALTGTDRQIDPGNEYVADLARRHPERIIQFYWVRFKTPDWFELMAARHQQWGFKGLKLHQCWERFRVASGTFAKAAKWAGEKGLPIFIHVYDRRGVRELIDRIGAHPRTVFIIGHLFGLDCYIEAGLDSDNICFEISTPRLVSKRRLERAVSHFGARRIIFGSDVPYGRDNQRLNIERVRALDISDADKDLILGGNMQRILEAG